MIFRCERGFALVESAATILFCIVALSGGLAVTYATFARVWLKRAAYENSVCLSTPATTYECERALRAVIRKGLPVGRVGTILSSRYRNEVQTRIKWQVAAFKLAVVDETPVPLLAGVSR